MKTHDLRIAGHNLTIRSTADAAYVEALARLVEARVETAREQGAGPVASALLAALSLAEELQRSRDEADRLRRDAAWRPGDLTTLDPLGRAPGPGGRR